METVTTFKRANGKDDATEFTMDFNKHVLKYKKYKFYFSGGGNGKKVIYDGIDHKKHTRCRLIIFPYGDNLTEVGKKYFPTGLHWLYVGPLDDVMELTGKYIIV